MPKEGAIARDKGGSQQKIADGPGLDMPMGIMLNDQRKGRRIYACNS